MNWQEIVSHYPEISGIHPACEACPPTNDEEFETLRQSISDRGLLDPIGLTPDGQLLDGRHRLRACFETHNEPRFTTIQLDPWRYVFDKHAARRNWTPGQRAVFVLAYDKEERDSAKERQRDHGGTAPNRKKTLGLNSAQVSQRSADVLAEKAGVGSDTIKRVRFIQKTEPSLINDLASGQKSVNEVYDLARHIDDRRRTLVPDRPPTKNATTVTVVTVDGQTAEVNEPAACKFNRTNDSVDWASWTWNPVTGCEHGCEFCYAREIAHSERMRPFYPFQFKPAFHEYRLSAPANTPFPNSMKDARESRVFVCSMADLFGKWVPDEWVQKVFDACLGSPDWTYLFLTKYPARYAKLPLIENAWYGASVIKQADVKRTESAMQKFDHAKVVRWISLEPMLEPIQFNDIGWCDLVVIGSQTSTVQPTGPVSEFAPNFDWIVDVVNQCRDAGVPYYLKANLGLERPGMSLPKMWPRL